MMWENTYCIHGIDVHFVTDSPAIVESIGTLLRYFQLSLATEPPALTLRVWEVDERAQIPVVISSILRKRFFPERPGPREIGGAQFGNVPSIAITVASSPIFTNRDYFRLTTSRDAARATLSNPKRCMSTPGRVIFTSSWRRCSKGSKFDRLIHATALEKNGHGVLIPGASGRGKTTSFISLLTLGLPILCLTIILSCRKTKVTFKSCLFPSKSTSQKKRWRSFQN